MSVRHWKAACAAVALFAGGALPALGAETVPLEKLSRAFAAR